MIGRRGCRCVTLLTACLALLGSGCTASRVGSSAVAASSSSVTGSSRSVAGTPARSRTVTTGASSGSSGQGPVPSDMDGPDVSSLPRAPSATATPELPAAGTAAERKQFLSAVFLDDQRLWASMFQQAGLGYRAARLVFFTSRVSTSCGAATSDVGPFYCPADHTVYLDTRFFDVMSHRFGVRGDFAEAYVVAHEVGHHVQTLMGITGRVASAQHSYPAIANSLSVRLELQADCYAGVWAHSTYQRRLLEPGDIQEAVRAAAAAGDDFLQRATTDQITPETFTHGTSAQRVHWLSVGFESGRPRDCHTFSG